MSNTPEKHRILVDILGPGKRSGKELLFFCPKCDHHNPKLSVNLDRDVFRCWTCPDGYGGKVKRLLWDFGRQHVERWRELSGISFEEADRVFLGLDPQKEKVEVFPKLQPATSLFLAWDYAVQRGLTEEDAERHRISVTRDSGKWNERILFPSFNRLGMVDFLVGRTYTDHPLKYINPRKSADLIFDELFVDWDRPIVLVEGCFDAVVASRLDEVSAIPLLGSNIKTESRLFLEIVKSRQPVYLALDLDARKKQVDIAGKFRRYGVRVFSIDAEDERDVAELSTEEFKIRFGKARQVRDMFFERVLAE